MKKLFALALVVFGLAACQTDHSDLDVQFDGNATITLSIPADAVTRAGGSDSALSGLDNTTDETIRFILAVYDETGEEKEQLRNTKYAEDGTLTVNFPVRLVPGRKYTFVAWADMVDDVNAGDKHYNTSDLKNITLNGDWNAMDETRDAFTANLVVEEYAGSSNLEMTLKRPFAKLRVIATDVADIARLGLEATKTTVAYTGLVATSYNAFDQEVKGTENRAEFTFDIAEYGDSKDGKLVLYTDYIFADTEQGAVNFSLTSREESGREINTVVFNTDIPVQRNMLTTLTGNVMTEGDNVTVTIDERFGEDDTDVIEYSGIINEPLVLPTGKYIFRNLNMNLSYDNAVIIEENANVTIDIVGNVNLKAAKEAIKVSEGATLTINGMQPTRSNNERMGVVVADGGIGGNNVTININDIANLTAKGHGDHAFGIGGCNATVNINNTTIEYVSGGHVQALFVNDEKYGKSEPEGGAAIGGAIVNIENSTITKAEGGSKAAAIGNNYWQSTEVVITNSELGDIFGGNASAAIGGSRYSSDISAENKQSSKVKIENSTITNAVGGQFGAGIGSGYDTHCTANETNSVNEIIIINSTITAKGGKYAAGIGTGFHAASLTGSIDATSTINATYGEPFYKSTYTFAQHIGYGVIDLTREGADLNVTFTVNGQTIALPGSLASYAVVMNIDEFNAALNATAEGDNLILFGADIEGNATVDQKENHNVVIDGCDYSYNGSIFIDGNSNNNNPETLTIQNINFYTEANEINFIDANNSANDVRYAHNVTINGCTFNTTGTGVVGLKIRQGFNIAINNCTVGGTTRNAEAKLHSLAQFYGCSTVTINNVEVNAKSGISFGTSKGISLNNSTIVVDGYGVRADGDGETTLTIKNNDITAFIPVSIRNVNDAAMNFNLILEGNVLTKAEDSLYDIAICKNEYEKGVTPEKPVGTYTLENDETDDKAFPAAYPVASWAEFTAALAAGETDIKLTADITFDANYQLQKSVILNLGGYSMTVPMINIHTKTTIKNGTINGKVYARKNSEIVFNNVNFSGAVADNLSTEGHLAIQGGCKSLYAKDCLFSPTSVSGSQTKPLSFEGGSTIMKFENCEFKSSPYKKQVYFNSLSATGSLDFTNCNFNNKTPNIMFAAACPLTNLTMSGTTKLSSVTLETNRAKDAVTAEDLAYLRESLIANNSMSSVRLFYAGGSSEYIR